MSYGLRLSLYFTVFCWACILVGVFAMAWCGHPAGVSIVLGVGPAAVVGTVATFVEWKTWKDNRVD